VIPKNNRLSRKSEITEVRENGRIWRGRNLVAIRLLKEEFKAGIVVSKKIDKRAVVRNRIRRIIMEAIREKKESWPKNWLLIMVRVGAGEKTIEQWREEIYPLLDGKAK
jgi:ribonuclease P protein component